MALSLGLSVPGLIVSILAIVFGVVILLVPKMLRWLVAGYLILLRAIGIIAAIL